MRALLKGPEVLGLVERGRVRPAHPPALPERAAARDRVVVPGSGSEPARAPRDESAEAEDDEVAPTPFDNPFFLPVILIGFAIWFIYDGWFNPDMEWIKFNRTGRSSLDPGGLLHLARRPGAPPGTARSDSPEA
jgi:hypothetical protein